jgi:hypothetical protein
VKLERPSYSMVIEAAVSGDWTNCAGATLEDVMQDSSILRFACRYSQLHRVPAHLLTPDTAKPCRHLAEKYQPEVWARLMERFREEGLNEISTAPTLADL